MELHIHILMCKLFSILKQLVLCHHSHNPLAMCPQSSTASQENREQGLSEGPWYKTGLALPVIPCRLSSWEDAHLSPCTSASDLCYPSSNSQIILLFLSLNEKETQALDTIRFRCEVGICVHQRRIAVSAAKARGGVTHHPSGEALS